MRKKIALGITAFEDIIGRNVFYVDKTYFIRDWYNGADQVTLITRPRRFGKTLTLNMVETFFQISMRGEEIFLPACRYQRIQICVRCREHFPL